MPQERENQYPYPTATDAANAPGDREIKAARYVVARNIQGLFRRAYIMGESDSAPIVQGVHDLTKACYKVLDVFADRFEDSSEADALAELEAILTDHGCPEETTDAEGDNPTD